jgi:hypothetical protein
MRARAGLHADDALLEQDALQRALDMLGVLRRHHVVGDDEDLDPIASSGGVMASTIAVLPEPTGPPIPIRVIFFTCVALR